MADRFFMFGITVERKYCEALVRSTPRSWRLDVWANECPVRTEEYDYELLYLGRIEPQTDDESEVKALVADLIGKKLKRVRNNRRS